MNDALPAPDEVPIGFATPTPSGASVALDEAGGGALGGLESADAARCYWALLYDVPEIIGARATPLDAVAAQALEDARAVMGAEHALLLLYDKNRELGVGAALGIPRDLDPTEPPGDAIARAVDEALRVGPLAGAADGRSFLAAPLAALIREGGDGRAPHHPERGAADRAPAERRRFAARTLAKHLGAIYVDRAGERPYGAADVEAFRAFAEHATRHLVLARLHQEASIDPLTGFHVRQDLEPNLAVEMTVATHVNEPLAIGLIEVDRYEEHAERLGRRGAEQLLHEVAGRLRKGMRARDLGFRYGAGKFLVLLPGADEEGALEAVRRLIACARGLNEEQVTLSGGVSVFPNHTDQRGDLIKKADQALFLAEAAGGDRVELWTRAIPRHALRTDKLIGIITGEPARDSKNVLLLLDAIAVVNSIRDRRAMLSTILDMMLELTLAERGVMLLPAVPGESVGADDTRERHREQAVLVELGGALKRGAGHEHSGPVRLEVAVAQDARKRRITVADFSEQAVARVARTGLPVAIIDGHGADDAALDQELKDLGLKLVIAVPLVVRSRLVGLLYVDAKRTRREVGEADLVFFQALAREIGVALENARLYEDNIRARREVEELNQKLAQKVETQAHELEETREYLETVQVELKTKYDYGRIVGKSERMQRVYRLLDRVTDTSVPVLIQGESGTGKELVAKAIHFNGPRKRKRFVTVNCAAIAPSLLESELFGHVKGAFTGADRDKPGLFEQAHKGTLFLDEVQDMSGSMQRELLRVLQEKELRRVGGKDTIQVDVRIIAATNKNLKELMQQAKFREDLYYRLNVVTIDLPPLRERIEDIPLLVERYLAELCQAQGRRPVRVTRRALRKLCRCHYSGNVRELHNVLERSLLMLDGDALDEDDFDVEVTRTSRLPAELGGEGGMAALVARAAGAGLADEPLDDGLVHLPYKEAAEAFKTEYVRRLLERHQGNVTKASQESGLVRSSLHKIMRKLAIDAKDLRRR